MNSKKILNRQNQCNVLSKKSKEKLLLALLAGGLATCSINTDVVSAKSIDTASYASSENVAAISKAGDNNVTPEIGKNNYTFFTNSARDVVINYLDLKNLDLTELYIRDRKVDVNRLEVSNTSIRIPKEVIQELSLNNGVYNITYHFSNGVVISNATVLIIDELDINPDDTVDPPVVTPPGNDNGTETPKPDNNPNTPVTPEPDTTPKPPADNTDKDLTATIKQQIIEFNRDDAKDVVIEGVNFNGLKLTDFYIYGRRINVNKLKVTNDSIIIPKEVMFNLYLKNSTYYTSAIFSDGNHVSGTVAIKITDNYVDNGDDANRPNTEHPTMITQGFEFDIANPKGIEITYVNFKGNTLDKIVIGNKILNSSNFTTTSNSIQISAEVLKSLVLPEGRHQFVFYFSNGVTLSGYSDLIVVESKTIVNKPSSDITIDEDTNEGIELPDLLPDDAFIDSITINNKILDVIYKDFMPYSRNSHISLASFDSNPVVYIVNNKLIIPTETLSYIGSSSDNYDISVRLDDGSIITQQLNVKSKSDDSTDKDNGSDKDNVSDKDNTNNSDKDNVSDKDNTNNSNKNDGSDKDNTADKDNSSDKNDDSDKDDTSDKNDLVSNDTNNSSSNNVPAGKSNVPKTGAAASTGLFAALLTSIAGIGFTKKKNK